MQELTNHRQIKYCAHADCFDIVRVNLGKILIRVSAEALGGKNDTAMLEYVPEGMNSYMCNLPKKYYLLPLHCIALKDSCVQCGVSVQ